MKNVFLIVLAVIGISVLAFTCNVFGIFGNHVTHSMENAVINYNEYESLYATCNKLNTDLGIVQSTSENDKQFEQFTKAQRINAIKQNLNRWVEEYNAKSKYIDKKYWKRSDLPQTLNVNYFSNFNK